MYFYLKWTAKAGFALWHELQVEELMEAIDKIEHLAILIILLFFTAFFHTPETANVSWVEEGPTTLIE